MAITATEVIDLIDGCTVATNIVDIIIADATTHVNSVLTDCDGLSDAEKEVITKWFAAHMVASGPHRDTKREKLMEAEVEYQTYKGEGLEVTPYGRMALALDTCGKLSISGKQSIKIHAVKSFD